jgi:hypothetical protein
VAATLVTPDVGTAALGKVSSAGLEINFGEYPVGTTSPYYGTARVNVSGTVSGIPFSVGGPHDSRFFGDGGTFGNGFTIQGAVAAPRGGRCGRFRACILSAHLIPAITPLVNNAAEAHPHRVADVERRKLTVQPAT